MKEKEFEAELSKEYLDGGAIIPVYWSLSADGDVQIDFESMQEEFDEKIRVLREIIEEKDELTKIVGEKLEQIKEKKK